VATNNTAAIAAVKSTSFGHPSDLLRILEKPSNTGPELNTMDVDAAKSFRVAFRRAFTSR
jgi:hypothetical protein